MYAPGSSAQQIPSPPQAARKISVRLNWELPGWLPAFKDNLAFALHGDPATPLRNIRPGIFWHDVFVDQRLNWKSIVRSYAGHIVIAGLIYVLSLPFYAQRLQLIENFHRDRLVYLNPEEDIIASEPQKIEALPREMAPVISRSSRGQQQMAAQPRKREVQAMAIPKWADNTYHTIVTPAAPKILASAPVPDIVLSSPVPQAPPVAAANSSKLVAPLLDVTPIAPPPQVSAAKLDAPALPEPAAIAPPVQVNTTRNLADLNIAPAPEAVRPEPKITLSASRKLPNLGVAPIAPAPDMNAATSALASPVLGPAQPIAPPPDTTTVANASSLSRNLPNAGQPVAPPPDVSNVGSASEASGSLISINLNPVAGPPREPDGSRRGAFAGHPDATPTATGLPSRSVGGNGPGGDSPVATKEELGIMAAAVPHGIVNGNLPVTSQALNGSNPAARNAFMAMARPSHISLPPPHAAVVTEPNPIDERVFRGRKYYTMALNKPSLTSAEGSWIFRFAERTPSPNAGDVTAPIPVREVDAAYPADLIHDNVKGVVILYAVIRADGSVAEVKVLEGFDDRLDENARRALSEWHFVPGTRDGNPVDLEAVVRIPFFPKRTF